ncbi:peptidoglycan-binding domain-containing protein, partial [Bradyrhizobium ottawaense]|uniref:peptidoglycan-binding domain-containing protein n=1 Tax=Bradyrhizobium ottawaense TaxID=931866 RepID=UPI003BA2976E
PRAGSDPMTNLVKATTSTPPSAMRPPAPIPVPQSPAARRIAGVQRALSEYGYGNLKITGTMSGETQAAIQKFEREHKMQVTGQRVLGAVQQHAHHEVALGLDIDNRGLGAT